HFRWGRPHPTRFRTSSGRRKTPPCLQRPPLTLDAIGQLVDACREDGADSLTRRKTAWTPWQWVHFDGTAGGHSDHRHTGLAAAPGAGQSQTYEECGRLDCSRRRRADGPTALDITPNAPPVRRDAESVFSVVAARGRERGLQSAGVLVSEGGFGILRTRRCGAHIPAG